MEQEAVTYALNAAGQGPSAWQNLTDVAIVFTGAAAVITAVCALVLARAEGRSRRVHERLSVKPLIQIDVTFDLEGFALKLSNVAFGYAKILDASFGFGDSADEEWNRANLYNWFKTLKLPGQTEFWTRSFERGDAIGRGADWEILRLKPPELNAVSLDSLRGTLDFFRITIRFESPYGEEDTYNLELKLGKIYGTNP